MSLEDILTTRDALRDSSRVLLIGCVFIAKDAKSQSSGARAGKGRAGRVGCARSKARERTCRF
jgi:hypothetical protein